MRVEGMRPGVVRFYVDNLGPDVAWALVDPSNRDDREFKVWLLSAYLIWRSLDNPASVWYHSSTDQLTD